MPYLTEDDKENLRAAYLPGLDTALQLDWLRTQPEYLPELMIKSALLTSKVYLTDVQFADHYSIRSLLRDQHFRELLKNDFDNKPAILVGLRKGCKTPVEAIDMMIQSKMIFSSLFGQPEIQRMINEGKISNAAELYTALYPREQYISLLSEISNYFEKNNIWIWEATLSPRQYFDLVYNLTDKICSDNKNLINKDIKSVARKFKNHLNGLKEEEKDNYTRSKAKMDLWKIFKGEDVPPVPTYEEGSVMRDFEKICLDFTYNLNIAFTNPMGIIWHEDPYVDSLKARFEVFKNSLLKKDALREIYMQFTGLNKIVALLRIIDFQFICELRTGEKRKDFKKGVEKITKAKAEDKLKRTKEHLNFVFNEIANSWNRFKKDPKNEIIINQEFPSGLEFKVWNSIESITKPLCKLDRFLLLGRLGLLLIRAMAILEFPYLLEYLRGVDLITDATIVGMLSLSYLKRIDPLRYPALIRTYKMEFSNKLVKEVLEPDVTE